MKKIRTLLIGLILLCSGINCSAQIKWYSFDKDFISAQFSSDSAIGKITTSRFVPAATVHSISCGGMDAELHIGTLVGNVTLPNNQTPLSHPPSEDPDWGIVAELPNANLSNGPALLKKLKNRSATFFGYFRVWDEGHTVGHVFPSNPHHVFEVHPAWGFSGTDVNFMAPKRVNSISGYAGYGVQKFKPLFASLSEGSWPLVYQKDGKLFLGLIKSGNFFQLPVRITKRKSITGGHEVTMDVFSNKTHTNLIYKDLAGVTVSGSPSDTALAVGDKTFLLGFFSVNLMKALEASSGLDSVPEAKQASSAVEFFIFGPALKSAVKSCS